jgi:hypothetical protein
MVHTYQNLADAQLGLGNWTEAIKFARRACSCVVDSPQSKEWYDATKTLGFALYDAGETGEAQKLFSDFVVKLSTGLDDNQ